MKRSAKGIIGYAMGATDGEIGKVTRFLFDDKTWKILYLIVETGDWLFGRDILISTQALLTPDWEKKIFPIRLSQKQIKAGPDVDTEKPVSRQEEIKAQDFYLQTNYWGGGFYAGGLPVSMYHALLKDGPNPTEKKSTDNPHLRSSKNVTGYKIHATDGEIGDVEDFIFDDSNWMIDFMVVDTGHWFPGKKVLVSPKWIKEINYETSTVTINDSAERLKNSPNYDPAQPFSEVYEAQLHTHYSSPNYSK